MDRSWFLVCALLAVACGPKLPPRYVLEQDVGPYKYRRYQQVLDIEIPIAGNAAVGYTATYVRGGATVSLVPVFVTSYEHAKGLTETVRARLRAMTSYTFDVTEVSGEHVFRLRGESGDHWILWVSKKQLLKLGAPDGETAVPEEVAEAYLDLYPSDLDEKGHAEDDAESAGAPVEAGEPQKNAEESQKSD